MKIVSYSTFLIFFLFLFACASNLKVSKEELKQKNYQEVYGLIDVSEVEEKPDKMPMYPGGNGGLIGDIQKNLNYPESAKQAGKEGNVIIAFTVNKKGAIENIKVDKGVDAVLDSAAKEVLQKLQPWYPAFKDGEAVAIDLKTLITFRIPQGSGSKITQ